MSATDDAPPPACPQPPSVRLPNRHALHINGGAAGNKPPIWAIDSTTTDEPAPLPAKCARHRDDRQGVCCKELKGEDERELIDPDVVRDMCVLFPRAVARAIFVAHPPACRPLS